jgi:hypothetical protein
MPHQLGSVFAHLVGDQGRALVQGERGEQTGLASRPGAQVEPPLRALGPLHRDGGQGERHQLGALVLHGRPTVADRGDRARVATGPGRCRGRPPAGRGAGRREVGHRREPRPRHERQRRGRVVRGQHRREVDVDVVPRRPAVPEQRLTQRLDDPRRVRLANPKAGHGVERLGGDGRQPLVGRPLAHSAQHGVDESGRASPVDLAGQRHGLRHRRMRGDPHPEQLMTAQPQRVQDVGIDRRQPPSGRDLDDRVVAPPQPQRPIGQLRGEPGVPTGHPLRAQHGGQFEVGIGPVRDGPQHCVCRPPRRVRDPGPFRWPLPRALLPRPGPATGSRVSHPRPTAPPARSAHLEPSQRPPSPSSRGHAPGPDAPGRWPCRHTGRPW